MAWRHQATNTLYSQTENMLAFYYNDHWNFLAVFRSKVSQNYSREHEQILEYQAFPERYKNMLYSSQIYKQPATKHNIRVFIHLKMYVLCHNSDAIPICRRPGRIESASGDFFSNISVKPAKRTARVRTYGRQRQTIRTAFKIVLLQGRPITAKMLTADTPVSSKFKVQRQMILIYDEKYVSRNDKIYDENKWWLWYVPYLL